MIGDFHFLRPYWLLAVIPVALLLWRYWHRSLNSQSWKSVCDEGLLPHILIDSHQQKSIWPLITLSFASILSLLALAGPVWKQLEQPVFREQSALIIILDLSRSMDASDIKPSRLARARHKVNDILSRRKEGQTALVVFAAETYTVSPLTEDADTIITLAKTLSTELMPAQGSHPEKALQQAIDLLQQAGATAGEIILITDGVKQSITSSLSSHVKKNGHRLSVLSVGTAQGAPISVPGGGYLKDSTGSIVLPKLDAKTLRQLASQSGGRYHELSADDQDLDYLLNTDHLQRLDKQLKDSSFVTDLWREEGPWLLLLLIPIAGLAFRRGYLVLIVAFALPVLPTPAQAIEWDNLWSRADQKAAQALNKNTNIPPTADLFDDPRWQAAAHYRAGDYEQASEALQGATSADDYYNRGNALAQSGRLQEALSSYDQTLKQQPAHEDALYNRDLVEKNLKQQQQQQDQQSDPDKDNNDNDDQQQQNDESSQQNSQAKSTDNQNGENSSEGNQNKNQGNDPNDEMNPSQQGQDENKNQQDAIEKESQQSQEDTAQEKNEQQSPSKSKDDLKQTETMQATEQWLRRIPDDPGGLLRRKFLYEHKRKQQSQTNNESSPW